MFSFVGDTVLDPFMGTATTNIAASRWGRNSIGIEVDPHYFELARKRLDEQHAGCLGRQNNRNSSRICRVGSAIRAMNVS